MSEVMERRRLFDVKLGQTLDLGCGDGKRGDIGVDHLPWPGADIVLNLGFEPLPFEDNLFERVYAWDLFEHLPKAVYTRTSQLERGCQVYQTGTTIPLSRVTVEYPHIQLFNEVWRVLTPDGIFDTFTPILEPAVNGRLFHVSTWNENQFEQFTKEGTDFKRGHMLMNGFKGEFEIVLRQPENFGIHVHLKAIKNGKSD